MATRTAPDDESSGIPVPSSDWNQFPRGELSRKTLSSDSGGTGGTASILSETVEVGTDRQIQLWATVTIRTDINGGAQAAIYFDGAQVQRKNIESLAAGLDQSWTFFTSIEPSAGSYTMELVIGVSGADGNTVHAIANGATGTHGTCMIVANDVGPAYT